jgi:AcrR family transcriptional regulator
MMDLRALQIVQLTNYYCPAVQFRQQSGVAKKNQGGRRGKGRPKVESAASVGREAVMQATCELLKITPPSRVTHRAIAHKAGIAASLVSYYFGSSDDLMLEVAVFMWQQLRRRSHAAVATADTPADKLFARTRALLQMHVENRYFNQLVMEHLLRGSSARARDATEALVQDSFSELSGILKEGVEAGEFRPLDPIFLYEAMLGACETFAASQRHLQMLLGGKPFNTDLVDAYARFLCDVLLNGMSVTALPARKRQKALG